MIASKAFSICKETNGYVLVPRMLTREETYAVPDAAKADNRLLNGDFDLAGTQGGSAGMNVLGPPADKTRGVPKAPG